MALRDMSLMLEHFSMEYGMAPYRELVVLLAALQAESFIVRCHHWMSEGAPSYGDHLMYERIYKGIVEDEDSLAERLAGLSDSSLLSPLRLEKNVKAWTESLLGSVQGSMVATTLAVVEGVQSVLNGCYKKLKAESKMTHGLENLLQGIADHQEGYAYLLRQRVRGK